jgi:hypothetical protein
MRGGRTRTLSRKHSEDPDQSEKADLDHEGDGHDSDRKKRLARGYGGHGMPSLVGPRFLQIHLG